MQQYLDLLKAIQAEGTDKPAARANMPGTKSLFGYQFRHDLADGFPLLTTKKMHWKGIVTELLWFLRGDTNIKYLVDRGVNIWNGDAYNYYSKVNKPYPLLNFESFIDCVKNGVGHLGLKPALVEGYTLGDCGYQYGKVWRAWQGEGELKYSGDLEYVDHPEIDQIKNVIKSLVNNPESRRHMVTSFDPAHDEDLALFWCHSMFQFNCRPLTHDQRYTLSLEIGSFLDEDDKTEWRLLPNVYSYKEQVTRLDLMGIPKYILDCQLYQRSADTFLGVPYNIASYSLLTHIIAKIVNMVPGHFIHSFGDAHIYDNHKTAVYEQLLRSPGVLPKLKMSDSEFRNLNAGVDFESFILNLEPDHFILEGYNPDPAIKAELSTG